MVESIDTRRKPHGHFSDDNQLVADGFISGGTKGRAAIVHPSPTVHAIFDDFTGFGVDTGAIAAKVWGEHAGLWNKVEGVDTGGEGSVSLLSNTNGGVLRLSAARNADHETEMAALHGGLNYDPAAGNIRMAGRVRFPDTGAAPNNMQIYFGFSDDTGTLEHPARVDTGVKVGVLHNRGDLLTVATDMVGIIVSTVTDTGLGMTAGNMIGVSSAGGVDQILDLGVAFTADKWYDLEVTLDEHPGDTGGIARFFVDGVGKGSISGPVAKTAPLAPYAGIIASDSGAADSCILDIDWLNVSGNRDTGV